MKIKKIIIQNFKSIYDPLELDFENLNGLIKLSGPIGAGKSAISEAIRVGLYGNTKDNNLPNYVSWNTESFTIELFLESKGKDIYIKRSSREQLFVTINNKELIAPSKRSMQDILEEFYDVPRMAVERMCVISFSQFSSLVNMSPGQIKMFLDDVFNFKTFSIYYDAVNDEKKQILSEKNKLDAIIENSKNQIQQLITKKENQEKELQNNININNLNKQREEYINKGIELKSQKDVITKEYNNKYDMLSDKMAEIQAKGKQERDFYEKFKTGVCPTCGNKIDIDKINTSKDSINKYTKEWKELNDKRNNLKQKYSDDTKSLDAQMNDYRKEISKIDSEISLYNKSLKIVSENYDDLISEYQQKLDVDEIRLSEINKDIGEWNDMNNLFAKTLRYNLLESIIPNINKSIQYYIDRLEQPYRVEFDQEFKAHIYTDTNDKQISYKDLSTGQKKTLDTCIIFGIIQNVIANVDFNIFFLDELFSNMNAEARNDMLQMLNENMVKDNRVIFVVNHAEMADDYFNHKIRVKLENKKILLPKKKNNSDNKIALVHASNYDFIF